MALFILGGIIKIKNGVSSAKTFPPGREIIHPWEIPRNHKSFYVVLDKSNESQDP
ncbi:hypothetical protein KUCAC02_012161 [Chaenocephalus aceratus]|uniref:Uncharacterized protein n=1 Tax=Chaenocephalus aceratus TaxID=36190 RepID=A0ACB9XB25_CHAAC|nr:hypothetical protein KUCAC02_012161 [Chaenocephalus aceratus]